MSQDSAKPKRSEVWQQEQPNLSKRLYLVVGEHRHEQQATDETRIVHDQHVLLDLESGRTKRVNVGLLHPGNGWSLWEDRASKST